MQTFSFLVASKNNASFIKRCLDSLLAIRQSDDEILIADESADQTRTILQPSFSQGLIRYVEQDKPGILEARRALLSAATKDYVFFVDADDCVRPDDFVAARKVVEQNPADILFHTSKIVDAEDQVKKDIIPFTGQAPRVLSDAEVRSLFFRGDTINNLWCKFVRRSAFSSLDWTSLAKVRLGEDRAISLQLIKQKLTSFNIPLPVYSYRELPQSASSKPHPGDIDDFLFLLQDSFSYLQASGEDSLQEAFLKTMVPYYINNAIVYAYLLSQKKSDFESFRKQILSSPTYLYAKKKKSLHFAGFKQKLEYFCFVNDWFSLPKKTQKKS
jgi:glycosyltransferase involved in cell wall biosynthesis